MTPLNIRTLGILVALLACISCQSTPEPYGCSIDKTITNDSVTVNGRFYRNNTDLAVHAGDRIDIAAWGTVCWEDGTCSSASGTIGVTYGLYASIGDNPPFFVGEKWSGQITSTGTLAFIIPEGFDIAICDQQRYIDNSGLYHVQVKVNGN